MKKNVFSTKETDFKFNPQGLNQKELNLIDKKQRLSQNNIARKNVLSVETREL